MGSLFMLKIELDGHIHGLGTQHVPKPWVARIDGPDPKYGLAREFVQPLNDWENARRAGSGNIYGRVAHFPMRRGHLYEISRLRGRPSKRHVAREFGWLGDGKLERLEPEDVLDRIAEAESPGVSLETDDDGDPVGEVRGLGHPALLPWIVRNERRLYRLSEGRVYVQDDRLVGVREGDVVELEQEEAWSWLR